MKVVAAWVENYLPMAIVGFEGKPYLVELDRQVDGHLMPILACPIVNRVVRSPVVGTTFYERMPNVPFEEWKEKLCVSTHRTVNAEELREIRDGNEFVLAISQYGNMFHVITVELEQGDAE